MKNESFSFNDYNNFDVVNNTEEGLKLVGLDDVIKDNNSHLLASGLDHNKSFF